MELKIADSKGRVALGSKYAGRRLAVREEADGSLVVTPVRIVPETRAFEASAFDDLAELRPDWDGRGSPAPTPETIDRGRETVGLLRAVSAARGVRWSEPHVGANERGDITLEWWNGDRALTLFIRASGATEYLSSWGPDIVTQMEDGPLDRLSDFTTLSQWLYALENAA